ncbi:3-beta hydroxysteroid dehydrogenase/isomerase [Amylocystis lapponica]|nr:3-beta hydroxysteroid dehydrogenase/isomerase [Amylocystis lapponica]
MSSAPDNFLVIGGNGFLGRHIVEMLRARGEAVSAFDIVQRYDDVPFYSGDISEEEQVSDALRKSGATCIIHTASPPHGMDDPALYWKVNVDGTKAVIAAAVANGVPKLVYTSSAGVVFVGGNIMNLDERAAEPEKHMDAYNESKAKAEQMVIAANGIGGLYTCAIRPAGIFGPGDRQVITGMFTAYQRNQAHFQIGDNNNLFDWTYVTNVAYAHLLAADKLVWRTPEQIAAIKEELRYALPPITRTTGYHRIPTSEARPLGPTTVPPANAAQIAANWANPDFKNVQRPELRSRFDQFADSALEREGDAVLQVAGQVFFITNGEPTFFWDFPRTVWRFFDRQYGLQKTRRRRFTISQGFGQTLGTAAEWYSWLVGKEPGFTKFRATYTCVQRVHNIEKARRLLGYEPQVGLEEGLRITLELWAKEHPTMDA